MTKQQNLRTQLNARGSIRILTTPPPFKTLPKKTTSKRSNHSDPMNSEQIREKIRSYSYENRAFVSLEVKKKFEKKVSTSQSSVNFMYVFAHRVCEGKLCPGYFIKCSSSDFNFLKENLQLLEIQGVGKIFLF
jgi:hypothetical protein